MAIVHRKFRNALDFEEVTDHVNWLRYASKERHHINIDEMRERPAYGWIYRPARGSLTADEHSEFVVRLRKRSFLSRRLYTSVK